MEFVKWSIHSVERWGLRDAKYTRNIFNRHIREGQDQECQDQGCLSIYLNH